MIGWLGFSSEFYTGFFPFSYLSMCKMKNNIFTYTDDLYLEIFLCLNCAITAQKNFQWHHWRFYFLFMYSMYQVLSTIMTVSTVMILNLVIMNFRGRNA